MNVWLEESDSRHVTVVRWNLESHIIEQRRSMQQNEKNCSCLQKAESSETRKSVGSELVKRGPGQGSYKRQLLSIGFSRVQQLISTHLSTQLSAEEMHLRLVLAFLLLLLVSLSSCCISGWNGLKISGATAAYGSGDCLGTDDLTCGPATLDMSIDSGSG